MLELYPPAEWDAMVAKFAERRTGDRVAQLFETFYIGGAHEVQVDRQGRILIPPKLREFAGLGRDVTFSAQAQPISIVESRDARTDFEIGRGSVVG